MAEDGDDEDDDGSDDFTDYDVTTRKTRAMNTPDFLNFERV